MCYLHGFNPLSPDLLVAPPNLPKFIFPSSFSGNWLIVTLTLTLIDRENSHISGNRVIVTPKPNSNKETHKTYK